MVTMKPFSTLTAADIMTQTVITVPREMSLGCAARLLGKASITGAPVVDEHGRCVGVLSATDFLRRAQQQGWRPRGLPAAEEGFASAWQLLEPDQLPHEAVAGVMTPDPVTTGPVTGIGELARMMVDAHIHRVIVVDRDLCPVGIVSSMDILAAVVQAEHQEAPSHYAL